MRPSYKDYRRPPRVQDDEDNERGVGVELEFGGMTPLQAAKLTAAVFAGELRPHGHLSYRVNVGSLGDFKVEADSRPLRERHFRQQLEELGVKEEWFTEGAERLLEEVALQIVPCEVTTPPIPITRLGLIDHLTEALHDAGAVGTHASPFYAFGLHFNPQAPSFEVESLLAHLRAFLLLGRWLVKRSHLDLSRRMSPYIDDFPREYTRHVLDPAYTPTLEQLVGDYLVQNSTRNRALDMLPLFAWLCPDEVKHRVAEPELLKPRPTFHYRLPDCRIGDRDWSCAGAWNRWVAVEQLASKPDDIRALARTWRSMHPEEPFPADPRWIQVLDEYITAS